MDDQNKEAGCSKNAKSERQQSDKSLLSPTGGAAKSSRSSTGVQKSSLTYITDRSLETFFSTDELPAPDPVSDLQILTDSLSAGAMQDAFDFGEVVVPPHQIQIFPDVLPSLPSTEVMPGRLPPQRQVYRTKSENIHTRTRQDSSLENDHFVNVHHGRSRSHSELLSFNHPVSIHFSSRSGAPIFNNNLDLNNNLLTPLMSIESSPSIGPALSNLPSVQLSMSCYSEMPDVESEDIVNCANIIFTLFQEIAPRDTERHIPTMICDYAYLCNTCGNRSPNLHFCEEHMNYECPTCWKTDCCQHHGSCTLCSAICPKCDRPVCKHCFQASKNKCDCCCLSLGGYNTLSDMQSSENFQDAGLVIVNNDDDFTSEDIFSNLPVVPITISNDPA